MSLIAQVSNEYFFRGEPEKRSVQKKDIYGEFKRKHKKSGLTWHLRGHGKSWGNARVSAIGDARWLARCRGDETRTESVPLAFTRRGPYKKNDQAFVEQKNGAIVRHLMGYGRFEGVETARVMARLYAAARLYVTSSSHRSS
jgi:hypothetical protein